AAHMNPVLGIVAVVALVGGVTAVIRWVRPHQPTSDAVTRHARLPLAIPVRLRIGEKELDVVSADISRGGMCLVADVPTSAGQPVELEFALPGQPRIMLYAVVRWHMKGSFGVLFDLHDRNRHAVADWVEAQRVGATPATAPGL
ncbi:MAG TPA: PilZ domain-containing protein, partial [Terriglobales bacterium]|nr:PilZ domain-containing protein [Terriglobales bacterium]